MRFIYTIQFLIIFISCNNDANKEKYRSISTTIDFSEYWFTQEYVDTVIEFPNERYIHFTKSDTVIHEEGIFTFMHADFEFWTDDLLVKKLRRAVKYEKTGEDEFAKKIYNSITEDFDSLSKKEWRGDSNGYWRYMTNTSIIYSYAFERINKLDEAIMALKPFLYTPERYGSKIIERYIKLCIQKYGILRVRNELNSASSSLKFVDSTYYKFWGVKVFGAYLDLDIFNSDKITQDRADTIVRRMKIYNLVN